MPLPSKIDDSEVLFRGIIEDFWDYESDRASSALFKDSKGVSVDRCFGRKTKDCLDFLVKKRHFPRVASIETKVVRDLLAFVKHRPEPDNDFHCEIYNSEDLDKIGPSKAKKLRDKILEIHKIS